MPSNPLELLENEIDRFYQTYLSNRRITFTSFGADPTKVEEGYNKEKLREIIRWLIAEEELGGQYTPQVDLMINFVYAWETRDD